MTVPKLAVNNTMKRNIAVKELKSVVSDTKKYFSLVGIISVLILLICIPFTTAGTSGTSSSDDITITLLSGKENIYHEGLGNSNQTVITDTKWALDKITVTGSTGARTVLDQFIKADSSQTKISRNALFIGSGSIDSESIYKGSNVSEREDNRTGIFVGGENYGVLIENGSLIFNESFGGIDKSIATGSGNYEITQIGDLGTFIESEPNSNFEVGDTWSVLRITGTNSGTLETLLYGSFPQNGTDKFIESTNGWANGAGTFYFHGHSDQSTAITVHELLEGWGDFSTELLFGYLEVYSQFKFEDYGQFITGPESQR